LSVNVLLFFGGLALRVVGANALVRGASRMAMPFGISPLVVGLTLVAFGTRSPEPAVSVGAVLDGCTDIAIGNVVGSNIFNVLFILGGCALIAPLVVNLQLIRQEIPIMLGQACCCSRSAWTDRCRSPKPACCSDCSWPARCC
jgi:cation:H+ antiporter